MTEHELDNLIHRYQNGLAKPEEINFLNDLQQANLTELQGVQTVESQQEIDRVGTRVWKCLMSDINKPRYWFIVVKNSFRKNAQLWAASVLIVLGLSLTPSLLSYIKDRDYATYAVNESTSASESVTLPDGSKIILKPFSSIALHQHFNRADRRVKLAGSAYFDVARNTEKPFVIHAGELVTKVLGTSFSIINTETNREIEVRVYTGKVSVQVDPSANKLDNADLLLTPNLKAVFHKDFKSLRESLSDNPTVLPVDGSSTLQTFNYHDQKLMYILKQLEDAYRIDIILLNETHGNRLITGDMSTLNLFQKLNLICSVTDLQYEIKGAKIILKEAP